jgi:hypothetical protein
MSGRIDVSQAELILESGPDNHYLRAKCSLCAVRFNLLGNTLQEKQLLREMFDVHVRAIHMRRTGDQNSA